MKSVSYIYEVEFKDAPKLNGIFPGNGKNINQVREYLIERHPKATKIFVAKQPSQAKRARQMAAKSAGQAVGQAARKAQKPLGGASEPVAFSEPLSA